MSEDKINPDHYKKETSLECIESMEIIFGLEAVTHFCICNAWKYIWRWKHKNGTEDLEKARWYIDMANYYLAANTKYDGIVKGMTSYINRELN